MTDAITQPPHTVSDVHVLGLVGHPCVHVFPFDCAEKRINRKLSVCMQRLDKGADCVKRGLAIVGHAVSLSVGVVAVPTVADAGGVASLSGESPALCTTCDSRLTDTAIRACSVRDCPHAQQEAA